jgi:hypothetical protein
MLLVPFVVYWVDDIATAWHHGGQESVGDIIRENVIENFALLAVFPLWKLLRPFFTRRPYHCVCPHCHFAWLTYRDSIPELCPRCHKAE